MKNAKKMDQFLKLLVDLLLNSDIKEVRERSSIFHLKWNKLRKE